MEKISEKKEFSIVMRAKSFVYAGRGIWIFFKTTHNAWIHVVILFCAIFLGFYFKITRLEWVMLVIAGGLVLAAEAFNTAIEVDMDLTAPAHHPFARDTKDVSAGAVLITAITALIIGVLIFGGYILKLLKL